MSERDIKELEFFRRHLLPAARDVMQEVYEGATITEAEDALNATLEIYNETFVNVKPS